MLGASRLTQAGTMGDGDLWNERDEDEAADAPAARPVAVALRYDPAVAPAPRVVASGKGFLAEQILAFAFAHGVKVRTDPDLAQILAAIDVDTLIPVEAFLAVAEILVYVYRANGTRPPTAEGADPR
jgi:flagellar biosynthesis protein